MQTIAATARLLDCSTARLLDCSTARVIGCCLSHHVLVPGIHRAGVFRGLGEGLGALLFGAEPGPLVAVVGDGFEFRTLRAATEGGVFDFGQNFVLTVVNHGNGTNTPPTHAMPMVCFG